VNAGRSVLSRRDLGGVSSSGVAGKENALRSLMSGSRVGVTVMGGTMGASGGREAVSLRGFLGSCTHGVRGVVERA
jgi:hypothetical protein